MKKLIAIFLNNKGTCDIDVSDLKSGNPGMGGTQFEFFILLTNLKNNENYEYIYFATALQRGLSNIKTIVVNDIYEAFNKCNELKVDLLISRDGGVDRLNILHNTKVIYWVHNFLPYSYCKEMGKNENVKRVVFVSYQHRDFYHEMKIANKAEVIFNSFYLPENIKPENDKQNIVVFVGNIVPIKKLHVVTKIWPLVVKKIPDAKLLVIGTGKTANRNLTLGPYNLAEESYEKRIYAPLLKNNCLNSVNFLGVLGSEKREFISKAKVAISPNDKETFCISALEYALSGVPVVAINKGGINDVVLNKITGIKCKNKKQMARNIIKILENKFEFNFNEGLKYFENNFSVNQFLKKWEILINEVINDVPPKTIKPIKPFFDKFKFVGILIKFLKLPDQFSRVGIASILSKARKHG